MSKYFRIASKDSLVEEIGKLEKKIWRSNNSEAENSWESISGKYLTGDHGYEYWSDLDESTLRNAIDRAKDIIEYHDIN